MLRSFRTKIGFTLIEMMFVVAIFGILAAIATPVFLKFRARAQQSEARVNLKAAFAAAKSKFADTNTYATLTFTLVGAGNVPMGFRPEINRRYRYLSGIPGDEIVCDIGNALCTGNLCGGCSYAGQPPTQFNFVYAAYGNVDTEPKEDMWNIDQSNLIVNAKITIGANGQSGAPDPNPNKCSDVEND